jgi:hypothetical protein
VRQRTDATSPRTHGGTNERNVPTDQPSQSRARVLIELWAGLVAFSRLVLAVHWPSDVLAAFCLGVFAPLLFSVAFDAHQPGRSV